jgi:two-component sensor histidine kinase
VFDAHIFPESLSTLLIIRFSSLPAVGIMALVLSRNRRFPRFAPLVLGVGVVVSGAAMTAMQVVTVAPENYVYFAGMLVLLFFCYGLLVLPFRAAVVSGTLVTLIHCGGLIISGGTPLAHKLTQAFIVLSVNIVGSVMSYTREQSERSEYAARHQVALQKGELRRHREYLERRIEERTRDLQDTNRRLSEAMEYLADREKTIEMQLRERTSLLQEVHHRVGNNLQTIGSLLELERATGSRSNPDSLRRMVDRVRSMAAVHSILYESGDLSRVSIDSMVNDLVHSWRNRRSTRTRKITSECECFSMPLEHAVPVALLINELLDIACTETREDPVIVSIRRAGGQLVSLTVSGVQWDHESEALVCSDILSNRLVDALTSQIGGTVGCADEDDRFAVVFPVSVHAC